MSLDFNSNKRTNGNGQQPPITEQEPDKPRCRVCLRDGITTYLEIGVNWYKGDSPKNPICIMHKKEDYKRRQQLKNDQTIDEAFAKTIEDIHNSKVKRFEELWNNPQLATMSDEDRMLDIFVHENITDARPLEGFAFEHMAEPIRRDLWDFDIQEDLVNVYVEKSEISKGTSTGRNIIRHLRNIVSAMENEVIEAKQEEAMRHVRLIMKHINEGNKRSLQIINEPAIYHPKLQKHVKWCRLMTDDKSQIKRETKKSSFQLALEESKENEREVIRGNRATRMIQAEQEQPIQTGENQTS